MVEKISFEDKQSEKSVSPFTHGELDELELRYAYNDIAYLYGWTRRAIKHYESEKNRLYSIIANISSLTTVTTQDSKEVRTQ